MGLLWEVWEIIWEWQVSFILINSKGYISNLTFLSFNWFPRITAKKNWRWVFIGIESNFELGEILGNIFVFTILYIWLFYLLHHLLIATSFNHTLFMAWCFKHLDTLFMAWCFKNLETLTMIQVMVFYLEFKSDKTPWLES